MRKEVIFFTSLVFLLMFNVSARIVVDSPNLESQRGSADVCGNGIKQPGEDCNSCPADAGCSLGSSCLFVSGNWTCIPTGLCGNGLPDSGENCQTCSQDMPAGTCTNCGNGRQDAGETCNTCPNDMPAGTCTNCGNGRVDLGETCTTCPQDIIATGGTCTNCGNGRLDLGENCASCPQDVLSMGGVCSPCNFNRVCDVSESCGCTDCFNSSDGCTNGNKCNVQMQSCGCNTLRDGVCSSDLSCGNIDPDCCVVNDASWSTDCTFDKLPVYINVKTGNACNNKQINFEVKEDSATIIPGANSTFVANGSAKGTWIAKRSSTCYPVIGCTPRVNNYYFVTTLSQNSKIFDQKKLEVRDCDVVNDADCDGILNDVDECPGTKSCRDADSKGCDKGQATCYAEWDCSASEWSECNEETGKRTRDTSRCIFNGIPNSPCANITSVTNQKDCLIEQEFPVFTNLNLIISISLLIGYYLLREKLEKSSK
ncbi:hypothetical protein HYX19_04460 [Candidatus Woesearchaeota archaeon]|nr:hypothetical protein [Candidatus Woesearchaeota archaeon]